MDLINDIHEFSCLNIGKIFLMFRFKANKKGSSKKRK